MAMTWLIRKTSHTLTLASPRILSSVIIKSPGKALNFSTVAGKYKNKSASVQTSYCCQLLMPEPSPDFAFTIEDIPGKDKIYLSREFAGEKITAEVYGPKCSGSCVGLWVKIAKGEGDARLSISLTAYSDGFQIGQIMFKDQGKQDEEYVLNRMHLFRYNFWTEFVRVRGLGDPVGVFLLDYMIKREDRAHLLFLKKLDEFISSSY